MILSLQKLPKTTTSNYSMDNSAMLRLAILFTLAVFGLSGLKAQMLSDKPNKIQLQQAARGYGMFIHFGVNTFNEIEWSDGTLPASSYNPTKLDCDQWVKVAKEAGFKYIILITKHHDGFCLWDSKYTDYDVASSPVKTDVVGAVAAACKKYGLELGLYYSLWDRHEPTHNDPEPRKYVDYMKNQLTELMTNYGKIIEVWFDGGWGKKDEEWLYPEVYAHIKKLQPSCQITVNHTISVPGKKTSIRNPKDMVSGDPIRFFPTDFRTKDPNIARWDDPKLYSYEDKSYYLNFEHTICLSDRWNWFQKKDNLPVRGLDELEELFYWCTSNNNILIVNVPPDRTGQIREQEADRVIALADRLGIRGGGKKLPSGPVNMTFEKPVTASGSREGYPAKYANDLSLETAWVSADSTKGTLEIDFGKNITFNKISLFEFFRSKNLGDGFSIKHIFAVEEYSIDLYTNNEWKTIYMGDRIGSCKNILFPDKKQASKIRINVLQSNARAGLFHVGVYDTSTKGIRTVQTK